MLRKVVSKSWPFLLLTTIVLSFTLRLFIPPSTFVTPDFGRSDILHSVLPGKLVLSQNLKKFDLPLWESRVAQGFPLMAEGIMGAFYLPNLILFGIFPFEFAVPLTYLSTFLIAIFGMFFLLRYLKINKQASLIGAISFSFCASIILHVQHINLIQSASLIPLNFLYFLKLEKEQSLRNFAFFSLLLSQLYLAGFVQIYFYLLILLTIFLFFKSNFKIELITKSLLVFSLAVMFSLGLSAIQLLPSLELTKTSSRERGLETVTILNAFPQKPEKLLTLINPFLFGNASDGTYNTTNWTQRGIFWESTSYIGLFPLFFAMLALVLILKHPKKRLELALVITLVFSIMLSFGKYSPLHILFSTPPLNFFRVPARFILFNQFFLAILAAYGANYFLNKANKNFRTLFSALLIVSITTDLFFYWFNYNPIGKFSDWFKNPRLAESIKLQNKEGRILSLGSSKYWNEIFTSYGWKDQSENYLFLQNSLSQNLNLSFGLSNLQVFEALPTRRYQALQNYLANQIKIGETKIEIPQTVQQLLDVNSVQYIVSANPVSSNNFSLIKKASNSKHIFFLYINNSLAPRFQLYSKWQKYDSVAEFKDKSQKINLKETLLLEKQPQIEPKENQGTLIVEKETQTEIQIKTQSKSPKLLLASDSYFPGWNARIDGQKTAIIPANLNSRAVAVPKGEHIITFKYQPKSFYLGAVLSLLCLLIALIFTTHSSKPKVSRQEHHISSL